MCTPNLTCFTPSGAFYIGRNQDSPWQLHFWVIWWHSGWLHEKILSFIKSQQKNKVGVSPLLDDAGLLVTTGATKAETLSKQYQKVFTKEDTSSIPDKGPSPYPKMGRIVIEVSGVEKLLSSLNPRKASGPDLLPTRLLKENASIIAPVLTRLFQQSLDSGIVPVDWTKANVSAIFKKGKRSDPTNYRPVSLTSITCKPLEHIIFSNIMTHADSHDILARFPTWILQGHICETQLINIVEELSRGPYSKQQLDCLELDFSKAFDTVPHQRLLHKLEFYGITGSTLNWIRSWITSRTQTVVVDGESSSEVHVASGVPQGMVLGPLMFLLYINDTGDGLTSRIKLFADDCLLFKEIKTKEDADSLQLDLDKVVQWSHSWQISFKAKKCSVLTVPQKKKPITTDYTMSMSGEILAHVDQQTYMLCILWLSSPKI